MLKEIDIKNIDIIIYDFDGVMTDNRVLVSEDGKESVFCNRSDGLAISRIKKMKIPQIIISTETNKVVEARAKKLGIPVIYCIDNKESAVREYCNKNNIDLGKVIFVGNDINDLEIMKVVGYPIAPSNASKEIKDIARVITVAKGSYGVIRELLDKLRI